MKITTSKIIVAAAATTLMAAATYTILQNDTDGPRAKQTSSSEMANQESTQQAFAQLAVEEPFEEVRLEAEVLLIEDPSQPSIHELPSGTVIKVPANAFADAGGETVATPVQLSFREFHNAAEIIASGIPMRIPKAEGEEDWLQTAGMFEIDGSSEGQPVEIAEQKAIEVGLLSREGGEYDFWIFDGQAGRWANQGAAESPQKDLMALAEIETEVKELRSKTARRPIEPMPTPEEEKLIFTDLDIKNCPELAGKNPLALTYAGKDEKADPINNEWITDHGIWRKKSLEPTGKKGVYQLTLLGNEAYRIPVKLALQGKNLEQARQEYQKALASYQADVALLQDAEALLAQQAAFRRTVEVASFKIYNYDALWKKENAVPLMADFRFEGFPAAVNRYVTVYLVTGDNRVVVGLPQKDWGKLRISPDADNKLIAVLPGDKVAIFSQSDFDREMDAIQQSGGSRYVFNMKVEPGQLGSVEGLHRILRKASS